MSMVIVATDRRVHPFGVLVGCGSYATLRGRNQVPTSCARTGVKLPGGGTVGGGAAYPAWACRKARVRVLNSSTHS
jgi:hypothetical protein